MATALLPLCFVHSDRLNRVTFPVPGRDLLPPRTVPAAATHEWGPTAANVHLTLFSILASSTKNKNYTS